MTRPTAAALILGLLPAALPLWSQEDVVMKAMRDELDRSMKQLQLANLEKPYFMSFRVVDSDSSSVTASFGALNHGSENRSRRFTVEVRVGDYKLDNTNFFSMNFNMSSMVRVFNGTAELPLDDDYQELRRQIWLATDATYKKSVEDLSKKRAALENKVDAEEVPDFTKEDPAVTTVSGQPIHVDRLQWESLARNLSGLFRQMPDVYTSTIILTATNFYIRYLNSDGTSYTVPHPRVTFNAHAATQAPDGTPLEDFVWFYAKSVDGLPPAGELASRVRDLGQRLKELRAAAVLENYNGPVLIEGDAAPQLFRMVFVPDLLGTRRVLMDSAFGQAQNNQAENPFIDKIGARVLPEFLSVTDNPTLADYNKIPLAGWCKVDEDGIPARETRLVEKGILKTLLVTRDPVRGIEHSTGSRHEGQAAPSNIFVTTENGLSTAELHAKLLDLVKQRNKQFGIVVRRMRNATSPVLLYKVFPDGHEELVHGVQFSGLNTAAFKDIVAASKDQNVLTVSFTPRRLPGIFSIGEEGYTPVTLVVPSLLFEDVTIRKARGETPKPPVAGPPYFDGK